MCSSDVGDEYNIHLTYIGGRSLVGSPLKRTQLGPRHLAQLSTTMIALWNQRSLHKAYEHRVTPTGIYNALMQETTIAESCDPFSLQIRQEECHVESQSLLACFVPQQSMKIVTPLCPSQQVGNWWLHSTCCGLASMHAAASPLRRLLSCEHGELSNWVCATQQISLDW